LGHFRSTYATGKRDHGFSFWDEWHVLFLNLQATAKIVVLLLKG
jgi:hypothetical protein